MTGTPTATTDTDSIAARLANLGLVLPSAPQAAGNYAGFILAGNLLAISGQLARRPDGTLLTGRVGADLTLAMAQDAARLSALNILAQANAALGDLSRITQTLRLTGFVQATEDFADHAQVINGASDLIAGVLGAAGVHSRAAVGAYSLPLNSATEIDALFMFA
jgi:enamine deaminase RidA (YjgF/YER057c/UK114 family)